MITTAKPDPTRSRVRADGAPGFILVVDDEEDIRDLIQRFLRGLGYSVISANDGDAALSQLARLDAVSLILCNLRMPHVGGAVLYGHVRDAHPALAERFVFCSGDLVSEPSRHFLHQCGRPCLEKPFELDHLENLARDYATLPPVRIDSRAAQRLQNVRWHRLERQPMPAIIG